MDPSALIFVALAVAWAVYLIPKALEHHEESARTRTVERFSKTMRVLARREPVSSRKARLVTTAPGAPSSDAAVVARPRRGSTSASLDVERPTARAAKRRRRVVAVILLANAVVAALAWFGMLDWVWCAVPGGALIAWLVACRLMVKRERAAAPRARIPAEMPAEPKDNTEEIAVVAGPLADAEQPARDPEVWDPVLAPLPTYVSKPVATRSVRTIDLDSTGVWSSGHSASDSKLVREADASSSVESSTSENAAQRASGA